MFASNNLCEEVELTLIAQVVTLAIDSSVRIINVKSVLSPVSVHLVPCGRNNSCVRAPPMRIVAVSSA